MHFKDAFQEIVPNGTAELIIRKENPESEEFNGVGIRVPVSYTHLTLPTNSIV